jgi:uncharacterized protein (DUF302 family)
MLDNPQSLAGIITKHSSKSVAQTVDRLTRVIADRGFTLFRVIDHSGTAERVGVQMPESKLVMFGKPTVGAAVMLAAPLAGLDLPLKVLVWEDGKGAVAVSYNAPEFLADSDCLLHRTEDSYRRDRTTHEMGPKRRQRQPLALDPRSLSPRHICRSASPPSLVRSA